MRRVRLLPQDRVSCPEAKSLEAPLWRLIHSERALRFTHPKQTVSGAVSDMNRHRVGCLLVTEGAEVIGIFTERDVLVRVVGDDLDPRTTTVGEVMTSPVQSILVGATVGQALRMLSNGRFRHLPVMDEDGLAGLVSIGDLTAWVVGDMTATVRSLNNFITGAYD
jgi:CBS domain-containing protein